MLDKLKNAQSRVVGIKQLLRELDNGRVECAFVAEDAEPHIKDRVMDAVRKNGASMESVETMALLGKVCSISVGAACAGILKEE